MQRILIASLAVLWTSAASVSAQCDCRTAASCPQAYHRGQPTGCYLGGTRNVGVCCPTQSSSAHPGFVVLNGGHQNSRFQGTTEASSQRFTHNANSGKLALGQTGFGRGSASRASGQTSNFGTSGQSSNLGTSGQSNFGKSGQSSSFGTPGQNNNFGTSGQTSSFETPEKGGNFRNVGLNVGSSSSGQSSRFVNPASTATSANTTPARDGRLGSTYYERYGAPTPRGECRPLVHCPPLVASPELLFSNGCQLADGSPGVICTFAGPQLASVNQRSLGSTLAMKAIQPMVSAQSFSEPPLRLQASPVALQQAQAQAQSRQAAGGFSALSGVGGPPVDPNSPTGLFNLNSVSTNEIQQIGQQALQSLLTIVNLAAPGGVPSGAVGGNFGLPSPGFQTGQGSAQSFATVQTFQGGQAGQGSQTTMDPTCTPEPPVSCSNSLFRTVTGECNNLEQPRLGKALTGFKRLLPNTFNDGIFAIRTRAARGGTLPSARLISERVLDVFSNELRHHTLALMQLSQFVDHDFTHALVFRLPNGAGIECCQNDGQTFPTTPNHPQCIPIPIAANDPFYSRYGQHCMSLVRSLPALSTDCVARPARPLNELTSFLDSSNVYGSSEEESRRLRAFQNGLLRESSGRLLPIDQSPDKPCRFDTCFHAGDTRVNEQSLLAVMHTIWMREHNRIARELQGRHLSWGDERLYQESRRVLIAEWQHILYNEWLPVVVGFKYADDHGLLPLASGHSTFYDSRIDPTISNAFASAAFRFGHTMVRDIYDTMDANGVLTNSFNLSSTFFDPSVIRNGVTEHARTIVAMRSETFDTGFARSLHEQLFTTNFLWGLDLLALNIQRGRDHGTPTYAQVVQACNLVPSVRVWGDLNPLMNGDVIDRLRFVYDDPRDVDLFIGGVGERLAPGAQVGPTFQCLIGQQFFDLRYGDRFFYDNGGQPHSFSLPQLGQIRRANFARIMCDTLGPEFQNDFTRVQPLAILSPAGQNFQVSCESLAIPRVDLGVF